MLYIEQKDRELYIEQKDRERYAEPIDELLKRLGSNSPPGHVNYVISRLIWAFLGGEPDYARCNEAMGVLSCVMFELYRRRVAPDEDRKAAENGDLPVRQPLNDKFANYTDVDDDPPDKPAAPHSQHNPKVADTTAGGTNSNTIPCHYYYGGQQFVGVETSNIKWLYLHRPIVNSDGTKCWMVYTSDKRELEKREANAILDVTDPNVISCYYYWMKKRHFVNVEVSNIITTKNIDKETRRLHLHWPILNPDGMECYVVYTCDKRKLLGG